MVLVFSVLAASLAKMAFFSSEQQTAVSPGGAVTDPVVMVETATIVKDLSLQGKVARDVDVTLRATSTGSVTAVHVGDGGVVDAGQALVTVKLENGRSEDTVSPAQRSSGAAGDDHRRPCPFTWTGLSTQVSDDGATSVRCSILTDQIVFPGLPAQLNVSVGTAENDIAIPATAVKGGSGTGVVWLANGDGDPVETKVELGVSDGTMVEVKSGLKEGDQVRQFVPGIAAPVEEFCYEVSPGEEVCETGTSW